jgi:hypothetical protein
MLQDGRLIFDDFKAGGVDLRFRSSAKFRELIAALNDG